MTTSTRKYGLLVAVDGSAQSDAAVRWAAREATLRHRPVTLATVVAPVVVSWPVGYLESGFVEWQEQNAQEVLEQAKKTFESAVCDPQPSQVNTEVMHGGIVATLASASSDADMVVVGSRGMGAFGRAVLGSTTSGLVLHAHCPVVVLHEGHEGEAATLDPAAPVVLGIDGSAASEAATAFAFDEASRRGVELVAVHAWSDFVLFPDVGIDWRMYEDEGQQVLGERLAGWHEQYPDVKVQRRIVCDQPARALIDESERAQLVVVGSHGRGGFTGMLLGSVGSAVVQGAKCPAIVVRT